MAAWVGQCGGDKLPSVRLPRPVNGPMEFDSLFFSLQAKVVHMNHEAPPPQHVGGGSCSSVSNSQGTPPAECHLPFVLVLVRITRQGGVHYESKTQTTMSDLERVGE